jgi:hypothetical protein
VSFRAIRGQAWRALNTPILGTAPRERVRRNRQRGFAYIMALIAVMLMLTATLAIYEKGATMARRDREDEMIWRGNQYKRAIRLYYHKTGKYPQTLDDLTKGLPQLHFLRQEYKDPTNKADGTWRFIYVNAAGSIIGSVKYATLQQMQILDMNGGVMPVIPGQPGVPASSLATGPQPGGINSSSSDTSGQSNGSSNGTSNNIGGQTGTSGSTGQNPDGSTGQNGGQNPAGAPSPNGGGDSSNPQNPQNPSQNPFGNNSSGFGQNPSSPGSSSIFGPGGSNPTGSGLSNPNMPGGMTSTANLAALAQLKPTGPVDGPVLGGFLTGVGGKTDAKSIKYYHGAKKLNAFEFIWNPLEDAAAALQNQMNNMQQGNPLGQGTTGPNGSSTSGGSSGFGSTFGNGSNPNPTNQPSQQPTQQPNSPPNQ